MRTQAKVRRRETGCVSDTPSLSRWIRSPQPMAVRKAPSDGRAGPVRYRTDPENELVGVLMLQQLRGMEGFAKITQEAIID
ncbi:MAG: hypothetical protein HOJ50_12450 [Proteobacteria bacterium]|nr:hypothetical protein [Pseudomonadota bacterium]